MKYDLVIFLARVLFFVYGLIPFAGGLGVKWGECLQYRQEKKDIKEAARFLSQWRKFDNEQLGCDDFLPTGVQNRKAEDMARWLNREFRPGLSISPQAFPSEGRSTDATVAFDESVRKFALGKELSDEDIIAAATRKNGK